MKLWSGRFGKDTDALVNELNASISFDQRLYREDITGSMAHAAMLADCGIISKADNDAIQAGLAGILAWAMEPVMSSLYNRWSKEMEAFSSLTRASVSLPKRPDQSFIELISFLWGWSGVGRRSAARGSAAHRRGTPPPILFLFLTKRERAVDGPREKIAWRRTCTFVQVCLIRGSSEYMPTKLRESSTGSRRTIHLRGSYAAIVGLAQTSGWLSKGLFF